ARLGGTVVVKAQVHAGGRGKAGGIKLADDPDGAQRAAQQILGMKLKTPQTPPDGILVRSVLVEAASAVERELYLSMTLDRARAERNPLVVTKDGRGLALDAKLNFDDNALMRHPEIAALRDVNEEDPLDVEASRYGLNYIKLDGNVGCMVNGAGLAMATMDIIKYAGGMPANFLDVGGGANAEQVTHAFEILLSDKNVKAVLINIFGGILRVDTLARGV